MNGNITRFYEVVSADDSLRSELVAVTEGVSLEGLGEDEARRAMASAIADFAAAHDLDLTAEDILAADAELPEGELSDMELDAVAGGKCVCTFVGMLKGAFCVAYGGGKGLDGGECILTGAKGIHT